MRAIRAGERAPRGEVVTLPGGHYGAFLGQQDEAADAILDFPGRHLLGAGRELRPRSEEAVVPC